MKIIKRLICAILIIIYVIAVVLIPFWWFIPTLLFGKSFDTFLNSYLNYVYDFGSDLFE